MHPVVYISIPQSIPIIEKEGVIYKNTQYFNPIVQILPTKDNITVSYNLSKKEVNT
jgi:hypothetical protein